MSYPMEFSLSNTSTIDSSLEEDFMLYSSNDEEHLRQHPFDMPEIPFPGEEGFSMFDGVPNANQYSTDIDSDLLNPDFFRLPASTARESSLLSLQTPLPASFFPQGGPSGIDSFFDANFGGHHGYPTPPSTIPSPYSPPTNNFVPFSPTTSTRARRQSSSRRRVSMSASSPPTSPLAAGASSPTGGKSGTNKTRHINSRACESKIAAPSAAHTSDSGCTKEYPCPIDGCSTVIKRRKDNLSVHLRKIHNLKMEVSPRQ
ncbi:hypothetical protein ABW21_db0202934 [Orbilia brochopaga]|nr:hypothetical protein ABW21_db0202934 [Drechslerella brochopaga]